MIYENLEKKLMIRKHEHNSGAPQELAVPAPHVTPVINV